MGAWVVVLLRCIFMCTVDAVSSFCCNLHIWVTKMLVVTVPCIVYGTLKAHYYICPQPQADELVPCAADVGHGRWVKLLSARTAVHSRLRLVELQQLVKVRMRNPGTFSNSCIMFLH